MNIYIAINSEKLGPYSIAEAQSLVAIGNLRATDLAWYEGLTDWIPLNQVPGFASMGIYTNAPVRRAKRPLLVWVICIFFFICLAVKALSVVIIILQLASISAPPELYRQYYQSLDYFYYGAKAALTYILVLTWTILLFRLKRQSLYFLIGLMTLSLITLIYDIFTKDVLALLGVFGLVITALGYGLNLALLYYNWHLIRKGVLR